MTKDSKLSKNKDKRNDASLDCIPEEVLEMILQRVLRDKAVKDRQKLTLVSKRWRRLLIKTSEFAKTLTSETEPIDIPDYVKCPVRFDIFARRGEGFRFHCFNSLIVNGVADDGEPVFQFEATAEPDVESSVMLLRAGSFGADLKELPKFELSVTGIERKAHFPEEKMEVDQPSGSGDASSSAATAAPQLAAAAGQPAGAAAPHPISKRKAAMAAAEEAVKKEHKEKYALCIRYDELPTVAYLMFYDDSGRRFIKPDIRFRDECLSANVLNQNGYEKIRRIMRVDPRVYFNAAKGEGQWMFRGKMSYFKNFQRCFEYDMNYCPGKCFKIPLQIRFWDYYMVANVSPAFAKLELAFAKPGNVAMYTRIKAHGSLRQDSSGSSRKRAGSSKGDDEDPYASSGPIVDLASLKAMDPDFLKNPGRLVLIAQTARQYRNLFALRWFPSLLATRNEGPRRQLERRFLRGGSVHGAALLQDRLTIRVIISEGKLPDELASRTDHHLFRYTNEREYRMMRKRRFAKNGVFWTLPLRCDTVDLDGPFCVDNLNKILALAEKDTLKIKSISLSIVAPCFAEMTTLAKMYAAHVKPHIRIDYDKELKCARFFVGPIDKDDVAILFKLLADLPVKNPDPTQNAAGLPAEPDDDVTDHDAMESSISDADVLPHERLPRSAFRNRSGNLQAAMNQLVNQGQVMLNQVLLNVLNAQQNLNDLLDDGFSSDDESSDGSNGWYD